MQKSNSKLVVLVFLTCLSYLLQTNVSAFDEPPSQSAAHLTLLSTLGYGNITDLAYSPDGNILAVSSATGVQLYDVSRLESPPQIVEIDSPGSLTFSPDGRILAIGQDDTQTTLWNVTLGNKIATLTGIAPAFSLDGQIIATADGQNLLLWDVETRREIRKQSTGLDIRQIAFTDDSHKILILDPYDISLWSIDNGSRMTKFENNAQGLDDMVVSPDGKLVAVAGFNSNGIWNTSDGSVIRLTDDWWDPAQEAVAFSGDGTIVAFGDANGYISLQSVVTGEAIRSFTHEDEVSHIAFSPDKVTIAIAGIDGLIEVWDIHSGKKIGILSQYARKSNIMKFNQSDTLLVSASIGGTVWRWDVQSNEQLSTNQGYKYGVSHGTYPYPMSLAISPDASLLATGESIGGRIIFWTPKGKSRGSFEIGLGNDVFDVAFSNDGTTLAAISYGHVYFWKVQTGERLTGLLPSKDNPWADTIIFSPDNKVLAIATSKGKVYLQEISTARILHVFQGHDGEITKLSFSPNGKILAVASNCYSCKLNERKYDIRLWDVETGNLLTILEGHSDFIEDIKFSPDGMLLASASDDNTLRLWNAVDGKQITSVNEATRSLAFNHKGDVLASGNAGGTITLWSIVYN